MTQINAQESIDWKKVGIEALSSFVAPIDLLRGVFDIFEKNETPGEIFQKILIGSVGFIPVVGQSLRGLRWLSKTGKAGELALRSVAEMTKWEKFNKITGNIQEVFNFMGGINSSLNGLNFLKGLSQWGELDGEEKTDTLINGARTLSLGTLFFHNYKAKKATIQTIHQDKNGHIDYGQAYVEQLGFLPSRTRAPKFEGTPTTSEEDGVLTIRFPENEDNYFSPRDGLTKRRAFASFVDMMRRIGSAVGVMKDGNVSGGMHAKNQFFGSFMQRMGFKEIRIEGADQLPKGKALHAFLTHPDTVDFATFPYAMAQFRNAGGTQRYQVGITGKTSIFYEIFGVGSQGLGSREVGPFYIGVSKGKGTKATQAGVSFLEGRDKGFDRGLIYLTPAHRTGNNQKLWLPYHGAFNTAVNGNVPLVPILAKYENGVMYVRVLPSIHPSQFQSQGDNASEGVANSMRDNIIETMRRIADDASSGYGPLANTKFVKERKWWKLPWA